jgi:hypothetical protein
MARVVVRDPSGRPRQLSTRTINARKEKEEILTEDAQGNEKRTEFKYGTSTSLSCATVATRRRSKTSARYCNTKKRDRKTDRVFA